MLAKKRKVRIFHCASAFHFQKCACDHERHYHAAEQGTCQERSCPCEEFRLRPGYPKIDHETLR